METAHMGLYCNSVCVTLEHLVFCAAADEAHYHLHCHFHGTSHDSTTTYKQRLDTFKSSKAKIMTHNKKAATATAGSQTLELNHFADWSREKFDRVMLPLKWKRDHGYEVQKVGGDWNMQHGWHILLQYLMWAPNPASRDSAGRGIELLHCIASHSTAPAQPSVGYPRLCSDAMQTVC
jgi:hypothetical protein